MKIGFLTLPPNERRLYIEQAALRRNVSPVVLEKDFWVCWILGILFESPFAGELVFKGGTSLSKVFGVIERFSEDIDLSLSPEFLNLPNAGTSRNQVNKWMIKAEAACAAAVRDQIAPMLEKAVEPVIGPHDRAWFESMTDASTNSPVILFHYPSAQPAGFEYLRRSVKLEFGSLTDQQPIGRHPIRPWIADLLPDAFSDWRCEVLALDVERTFWEKPRFCTRNTIGPPRSRRRTAFPDITRIPRHWPSIQSHARRLIGTTSAAGSCSGSASTSAAHGRITTTQNLGHSALSLPPNGCRHFAETIRRCGTCT